MAGLDEYLGGQNSSLIHVLLSLLLSPAAAAEPEPAPTPPASSLRTAVRLKNGEVHVGQPGEIHADITSRLKPKEAFVDGFVDSAGNFLTRTQAAQHIGRPDLFGLDTTNLGGGGGGGLPIWQGGPTPGLGGALDQEIEGTTKNRVGRTPLG